MDVKDAKTFERAELQPLLDSAISALCLENNIETVGPPDSLAFHHGRRLARCLIRLGVRMCLKLGAPPEALLPICLECVGKEAEAFVNEERFKNGGCAKGLA